MSKKEYHQQLFYLEGLNKEWEKSKCEQDTALFIYQLLSTDQPVIVRKNKNAVGIFYNLECAKGMCPLVKHPTQNYYYGNLFGRTIHFMPKKTAAKLVTW